jgi:uncharacterized lipoprotein
MLKLSLLANRQRMRHLATALSVALILLGSTTTQAERFKQRGVSIPDAPDTLIQGATRLDRTESGAELTVPLEADATWELLNRVLANLTIKPLEQDAQDQQLLTDWILWTWDPDREAGGSQPPLKALSRTYERHRFQFSVRPDAAGAGALIYISDNTRQREIDITPDSEYTWLQWQDAALQADAAWSFMRRLQGNFESALSSRLVPSTVAAPRIIEPVRPPVSTQQATPGTPMVPVPASAPAAIIVEPTTTPPVPAPVTTRPSLKHSSSDSGQSKPHAVEVSPVVTEEPTKVVKKISPASPSTPESQPAEQTPDRTEKFQTVATPSSGDADTQLAPAPMVVQGGLLVDGGLDASWQALLAAIDALDIKLQSSDQAQHILTTEWINARYEKKNQQFTVESKAQERWAFDLRGKGRERHGFQLIMIPVDGGARTMVYAYHTGYQVETDQTPDSSQTLLYWKDHSTDPSIAMAFLRRLQLVVKQ